MDQTSDTVDRSRQSLGEVVAADLVRAIIRGDYGADKALPSESELAEAANVSRLTMREAMKMLRGDNVVRVQPGRGTYVNPSTRWTGLRNLILAEEAADGQAGVAVRLIESRMLIEIGVAEMAAERRSDEDVEHLERALERMEDADQRVDVETFVTNDLAFHQCLMDAVGNVFISALFHPLRDILRDVRMQTSSLAPIREHAIAEHRAIIDRVRVQDAQGSGAAMRSHLLQTRSDIERFLSENGR